MKDFARSVMPYCITVEVKNKMICTECNFRTNVWYEMKSHYNTKHPKIKNITRFFTKEAREK